MPHEKALDIEMFARCFLVVYLFNTSNSGQCPTVTAARHFGTIRELVLLLHIGHFETDLHGIDEEEWLRVACRRL